MVNTLTSDGLRNFGATCASLDFFGGSCLRPEPRSSSSQKHKHVPNKGVPTAMMSRTYVFCTDPKGSCTQYLSGLYNVRHAIIILVSAPRVRAVRVNMRLEAVADSSRNPVAKSVAAAALHEKGQG